MPQEPLVTLTLSQALDLASALSIATDELESIVADRRRRAAAADDPSRAGDVHLVDQAALRAADALLVIRDAITGTATYWNDEQRRRVQELQTGD